MIAKIFSAAVEGVDGVQVEVEVDIANGLPAFSIVGLPEVSVRESKDRVKAAIQNSSFSFPNKRLTVNLAPADLKKSGTGFDLPVALGVLVASGVIDINSKKFLVIGELSLDGLIKPVPGILPVVLLAKQKGFDGVIVPYDNAREGAVVRGIDVYGVHSLGQAVDFLSGQGLLAAANAGTTSNVSDMPDEDFAEVKGQEYVKRALEIAAAGGHNVLLEGPPGAGKTMLARRVPGILPPLQFDEAIDVTKIYSVSGKLPTTCHGLITKRPFRSPHHTVSDAGLIGGGQKPRPGEITLAHNGVLFLDELTEFKRPVLESLRQPLEDGFVTISRATSSVTFPAQFILVGAMNPCPCGHRFSRQHECSCTPSQVQHYMSRLSGPLLDRFDIHIEVPAVPYKDLKDMSPSESSGDIRKRVIMARDIQNERYKRRKKINCNAHMGSGDMRKYCTLDSTCQNFLEKAVEKLGMSARAYTRILKLARTIADHAGSSNITSSHVAEAVQYRRRIS